MLLFVSASSSCQGWAAACDCGTPWTFLLPFLYSTRQFVLSLALCYIVLVCFLSLFSIVITSLGKELILVLFVRLFDLHLFGFVSVLFLLVSWKGSACECGTPGTFLLPFVPREASF